LLLTQILRDSSLSFSNTTILGENIPNFGLWIFGPFRTPHTMSSSHHLVDFPVQNMQKLSHTTYKISKRQPGKPTGWGARNPNGSKNQSPVVDLQ
jgi:hypothetical protein